MPNITIIAPGFENAAYASAIEQGTLSDCQQDLNYAGDFMLMYCKDGRAYFKHTFNRRYISVPFDLEETLQ